MLPPRLLLRAFGIAILAMIANVATAFLWVWIYSMAIVPGRDPQHYQAYAQTAAPVTSIVAGIPMLFAAGWLVARGQGHALALRAGLAVGICYVAIDLLILLVAASPTTPWGLVGLSFVTKLAAAWTGGQTAARRTA